MYCYRVLVVFGIISACAERSHRARSPCAVAGDHLRVCGAVGTPTAAPAPLVGSSPRVRSGPDSAHEPRTVAGIISACAERSEERGLFPAAERDHLRVCGAVRLGRLGFGPHLGSSPRVRSGRTGQQPLGAGPGIISACAERSSQASASLSGSGDHLRVCGAVEKAPKPKFGPEGSSPRVRSGHVVVGVVHGDGGIISACAERSYGLAIFIRPSWDHLRVCGAVSPPCSSSLSSRGSSPRVRSGPASAACSTPSPGIISACAERSRRTVSAGTILRDHLRVCGAVAARANLGVENPGSSPRVRSGPPHAARRWSDPGIISACAERSTTYGMTNSSVGDHLRVCGAVQRSPDIRSI